MKLILDLDQLVKAGFAVVLPDDVEPDDLSAYTAQPNDIKLQRKSEALEILHFLNEKAGKKYPAVDANLKLIIQRLQEYGKDQLFQVVARKTSDWQGTDMEQYLRPATLFNRTKCAQYIGELVQPRRR